MMPRFIASCEASPMMLQSIASCEASP
jgi:hypothetical protein